MTVVIVTVVIVTVVIVTVVTVVIVTYLSKNNLTHSTTEAMFEGQRFAILAMFSSQSRYFTCYFLYKLFEDIHLKTTSYILKVFV